VDPALLAGPPFVRERHVAAGAQRLEVSDVLGQDPLDPLAGAATHAARAHRIGGGDEPRERHPVTLWIQSTPSTPPQHHTPPTDETAEGSLIKPPAAQKRERMDAPAPDNERNLGPRRCQFRFLRPVLPRDGWLV
jgi:hypothetical protein